MLQCQYGLLERRQRIAVAHQRVEISRLEVQQRGPGVTSLAIGANLVERLGDTDDHGRVLRVEAMSTLI